MPDLTESAREPKAALQHVAESVASPSDSAETPAEVVERAATWETQFDAGPGDVVSVKDAAWVIAKNLLIEEAEGA